MRSSAGVVPVADPAADDPRPPPDPRRASHDPRGGVSVPARPSPTPAAPGPRPTSSTVAAVGVALTAVVVLVLLLAGPSVVPPWSATPYALLLAVVVAVAELKPVPVHPRRREGVPLSWGFVVALSALGPLSLALTARCLPVTLRGLRRGVPGLQLVGHVGRAALGVLTCRVVVCLLVDEPLTGGAVLHSPREWPAVLVAGLAGLAVEGAAVLLVRRLRHRGPRTRRLRSGSASGPLLTLVVVASAPLVVVSAEGGALLLALVCLPVGALLVSAALARRHERRALLDELTGLANREALQGSISRALRTSPAGRGPGLLVVDLDHFKDVNDTLGHPVGDALLREVAERLVAQAPVGALVARLGGDEFALLVADAAAAEDLALAVVEEMARPLRVGELQVLLPASVGVALAPEHGTSASSLLKSADVALYQAKELRGRACTYAGQRDVNSIERLRLLGDLGRAVDRGELYVRYQPQVDPATGLVVGAEALVRWRHPDLGPVPPDRFIPLAEQSGLVHGITGLVLDTALADVAGWRAEGHGTTVSVNLSARVLTDVDLPDLVAAALARHRVAAAALVLEITETGIMSDLARAGAVVRRLRALGCSVAVDDFGTGHCSLGYLTDLDVDELKIDRSFVTAMNSDRARAVIVRSTVQLGRDLGMRVVAEGVEDARTQRVLADLHCHVAQGEHVGSPTGADGILRRLRAQDAGVEGGEGPVVAPQRRHVPLET